MVWIILKLNAKYLIWSTIVDAPVYTHMTREELFNFMKMEFGRSQEESIKAQIERADKTRSGSRFRTLDEVISGNRAGEGESEMTKEELFEAFG